MTDHAEAPRTLSGEPSAHRRRRRRAHRFQPLPPGQTDPVPSRSVRLITPAELDAFLDALPAGTPRLLVECAIETGIRWGELTELRVGDFDRATGVFTLARAVVCLTARNQPDGQPFHVEAHPKGRELRHVRVDKAFAGKIAAHIESRRLGDEDLLFPFEHLDPPAKTPVLGAAPGTFGYTGPDAKGRIHAHGTLTAYTDGKCRCQHCRAPR